MAYHNVFGCWCVRPAAPGSWPPPPPYPLPQLELQAYTSIHSTVSRTKLKQVFINETSADMPEVQYSFPLYDGVSVVSFKCTIGERVIFGLVKERNQARAAFDQAKARGEATALLEQTQEASDVFVTRIGKVPNNAKAVVEIEYVGELTHDAQLDGTRFTIPQTLAQRYGTLSPDSRSAVQSTLRSKINILVDVEVDHDMKIDGLTSPSHAIQPTLGRTSVHKDVAQDYRASATLCVKDDYLEKDFVLVVKFKAIELPKALLEQHPTIPDHKAVMATLVPKFNLPNISPEIVFVIDRSGSMDGKMRLVIEALGVFLKSLPLSAKFNICSFGSAHDLMFPKSIPYDERSLQKALGEVKYFAANFGGTELLRPIQHVVQNRLGGTPLEIMVLTDGEIWNQQETFDFVNEAAKSEVRVFSLGIGAGASSSLVRGLARAGNGFAQFVQDNEKMDRLVVRMLKAALSPHITDYRLELEYAELDTASHDDFEMIEPPVKHESQKSPVRKKEDLVTAPITLFDPNFQEETPNPLGGRYDHLPQVDPPKELQAPSEISGLFPYNRVSAYMLLPNSTRKIKSVILKGTYKGTLLKLDIPVQDIGVGKTVHQLAAKKAMLETEEGRGWLANATLPGSGLLKDTHRADWDRIIEREAVRLGVQFQIPGKFCSFVAVDTKRQESGKQPDLSSLQADPEPEAEIETDLDCSDSDESPSDWDLTALGDAKLLSINLRDTDSHRTGSSVSSTSASFGNVSVPSLMQQQQAQSQSRCGQSFGSASPASGVVFFSGASAAAGGNWSADGTSAKDRRMSKRSSASSPKQGGLFGGFGRAEAASTGGVFGKSTSTSSSTTGGFGSTVTPPTSGIFSKASKSVGGLFGNSNRNRSAHQGFLAAPPPPAFGSQTRPAGSPVPGGWSGFAAVDTDQVLESFKGEIPPAPPAPPAPLSSSERSSTTRLHQVIALQRFDGSWTASDDLLALLGVWRADFNDADLTLNISDSINDMVKATIMAIAWLEKEASDEAEVWDMIADKAKAWLVNGSGYTTTVSDIELAVRKAMGIFFP